MGEAAPNLLEGALGPLEGSVVHDHPSQGDGSLHRLVGDIGQGPKDCRSGAGLGSQIRQGTPAGDLEPIHPEPLAQGPEPIAEERPQGKDPDFLGITSVGQHPVEIGSPPLVLGVPALPIKHLVGVFQAQQHPGNRGRQEDEGHPPAERDQ